MPKGPVLYTALAFYVGSYSVGRLAVKGARRAAEIAVDLGAHLDCGYVDHAGLERSGAASPDRLLEACMALTAKGWRVIIDGNK